MPRRYLSRQRLRIAGDDRLDFRLAKLCAPGNRPGEGACLRRLEYRRREGTGVPVWALTAYGRSMVPPLVPWLRPPAAHDVGARFLEHTLLLNDVLAGWVAGFGAGGCRPSAAKWSDPR